MPTHLTMALARSLPGPSEGAEDKLYFDDDARGLALRVRSSGGRSWIFKYRVGSRSVKATLGSIDAIDIAKARTQARDLGARVRFGADPAREKREARLRADETLGQLAKKYLERKEKELRYWSHQHCKRHLLKHLKVWHSVPIVEINRRMVAQRISELAESNGPYLAGAARHTLSDFFAWAIRSGLAEANPVLHTDSPIVGGPRERVVSDQELRRIWWALDNNNYGKIVRLLILTGARLAEIGNLAWAEIDFEGALISLAANRTKNARPHTIPLSPPVLEILQSCPQNRERLFSAKGSGFGGWTAYKTDLLHRLADDGGEAVPQWTHHDFRRSISTALHDRFNVPPHVVEAILGHVSGYRTGVAATYNKASYIDERRRALTRWADHIMALVSGEPAEAKVINLR
jgi:integrase